MTDHIDELEPRPTEKRNVRYVIEDGERLIAKIWEVWATDTEEKIRTDHKSLTTGAVMARDAEGYIKRYDRRDDVEVIEA